LICCAAAYGAAAIAHAENPGHGGLRLLPSLEIGADTDLALRVKPELRFESDWSRHAFDGKLAGELVDYVDGPQFSRHGAEASSNLRLDVHSDLTAELHASYKLTSVGDGNIDLPSTAIESRTDHSLAASAGLTRQFGSLHTRLRLGAAQYLFDDVELAGGGREDNVDRAYFEPQLAMRASYNTGARLRPFADVSYAPRMHNQKLDRSGLKRHSQGGTLALGLAVDDAALWSGEIASTYALRDYEDANLATADVFGVAAALSWRPSELTTLTFTSSASLQETSIAGLAAARVWDNSLELSHALRDSVGLRSSVSLAVQDESGQTDISFGAKASIDWTLNPYLVWSVGYEGQWQQSGFADSDEQRLLTSVILRRW
jgi:hypothetical protein